MQREVSQKRHDIEERGLTARIWADQYLDFSQRLRNILQTAKVQGFDKG